MGASLARGQEAHLVLHPAVLDQDRRRRTGGQQIAPGLPDPRLGIRLARERLVRPGHGLTVAVLVPPGPGHRRLSPLRRPYRWPPPLASLVDPTEPTGPARNCGE